jgi:hypothetical protein
LRSGSGWLFRPIATDVKAEKRFLSTIARRLDSLGAITKGQRQTGGQGLFRPEDNLESVYARAAVRQLYMLLYSGRIEGCSLQRFVEATGLTLTDKDGSLRQELPPISQFLNRLLALTIDLQNTVFGAFEALLEAKIEGAMVSGTYDIGVETITAASLRIVERSTIYTHPGTGAETQVFTIARRDRNEPLLLADALDQGAKRGCRLLVNGKSHRAAYRFQHQASCSTMARSSAAFASSDPSNARHSRLMRCRPRHGVWPIRRRLLSRGKRRSPSSPPSARALSTLSPASCCRSGGSCRTTEATSTVSRRTTASASSAARCPRPGWQRPARRGSVSLLPMLLQD